jgi:undecaprenyl-diphosphatase
MGAEVSWRTRLHRLGGRVEPAVLVSLLALAGFVWLFFWLAGEVGAGDTTTLDTRILLALRNPADHADPIGPGWIEEFGRDVTALGGIGVLTFLTVAAAVFLWLAGHHRAMWYLLVAVSGGQLISSLSKRGFDRPRPDLVPHEAMVYTASFPSGHAMMAAVTYLTLAVMLARTQPNRALKAYLLVLAATVTVAVGVSRVYLGVHWPSDVLAGWTAGAAWALGCWLIVWRIDDRGGTGPSA